IVPAYNEAQAIRRVIEDLQQIELEMDILVVNDGSADSTSAEARATGQAMVVDLPKNLGIGGAVQTGFKYAARNGYRSAIQFDGDGQHLASEIPNLLTRLEQDRVNMVIGSRFLDKFGYRSTFIRRLGIRLFEWLNFTLIGQRSGIKGVYYMIKVILAITMTALRKPVAEPGMVAAIDAVDHRGFN
ncbi:MAG: glycosyltransferase family 2 protein, partial [Deltaproteobacteria bacterium]